MADDRWLTYAVLHGHQVMTCACVGCRAWRRERPHDRVKKARNRGYLWLSDTDDSRLKRLSLRNQLTLGELVRRAIHAYLAKEEARLGISDPD